MPGHANYSRSVCDLLLNVNILILFVIDRRGLSLEVSSFVNASVNAKCRQSKRVIFHGRNFQRRECHYFEENGRDCLV